MAVTQWVRVPDPFGLIWAGQDPDAAWLLDAAAPGARGAAASPRATAAASSGCGDAGSVSSVPKGPGSAVSTVPAPGRGARAEGPLALGGVVHTGCSGAVCRSCSSGPARGGSPPARVLLRALAGGRGSPAPGRIPQRRHTESHCPHRVGGQGLAQGAAVSDQSSSGRGSPPARSSALILLLLVFPLAPLLVLQRNSREVQYRTPACPCSPPPLAPRSACRGGTGVPRHPSMALG